MCRLSLPIKRERDFGRKSCHAVAAWDGLNTDPGPLVRSNTGSPALSGGPRNTRPCRRVTGAGNTWGVVTSVPACSTVPATAVDGTHPMAFTTWFLARLRFWRGRVDRATVERSGEFEALVRAHGDWLALLATILEREHVIAGDALARSLREFATLTAADRPAEGKILSFWAAYLQDTSVVLGDLPSLH